jgi:hypothetical protein
LVQVCGKQHEERRARRRFARSQTTRDVSRRCGDATAGDGIWTAIIPGAAFVPGEMTRWRFSATDSHGTETKEPAFHDPLDSHQYFGTVGSTSLDQAMMPPLRLMRLPVKPERFSASIALALRTPPLQ